MRTNMECKGVVRRLAQGWVCECPGTQPGYGATPEAAWYEWVQLLNVKENKDV